MSNRRKNDSAKNLIKNLACPVDAPTLFQGLALAGFMEQCEYVSSTGSGEIKSYWRFAERGLRLGVNRSSSFSQATTPRFYADTFLEAVAIAALAVHQSTLALLSESCGSSPKDLVLQLQAAIDGE